MLPSKDGDSGRISCMECVWMTGFAVLLYIVGVLSITAAQKHRRVTCSIPEPDKALVHFHCFQPVLAVARELSRLWGSTGCGASGDMGSLAELVSSSRRKTCDSDRREEKQIWLVTAS